MQPYFLPYIGYFQLIGAVDTFVVYDNIKYTKKGWVNRNRYLINGTDATFSIPLKKDSDFLDVRDREISLDFNKTKFINQIREAYRRAPYLADTLQLLEKVMAVEETNLFLFLHASIEAVCDHLGIRTPIIVSSAIDADHALQAQDKVLAICEALGADAYVNPIGGTELYSKQHFAEKRIAVSFLKSDPVEYPQFDAGFVPWLSIIDVMMFNSRKHIENVILPSYRLV